MSAETPAPTPHLIVDGKATVKPFPGYQVRDHHVVDYRLYELPKVPWLLRGPRPNLEEPYFVCAGAAQTFGRFCEKPYPLVLQDALGLPALNLGIAGAGPRFFVRRQPKLLNYINAAQFAVLQVMSARSEDNSLFESGGREYLSRRVDGRKLGAEHAYAEALSASSETEMRSVIVETRRNWIASFCQLLDAITVPTALFWFSKRRPSYTESYTEVQGLFGDFPQLVNAAMVDQVRRHADIYVECVSTRGSPHPLVNRFTGEPALVVGRADLGRPQQEFNTYYPSPEMHRDAASALMPWCARFIRTAQVGADESNRRSPP